MMLMRDEYRHLVNAVLVLAAAGLIGLSGRVAVAADTGNSCIDCHTAMEDEVVSHIDQDVHFVKGLACQDCHGGNATRGFKEMDSELAHDKKAGFVGAPSATEIPSFCARCHSDVDYMREYNPKLRVDQYLEYQSSEHGKRLKNGDTQVATCVSCHGVHGILAVTDTRAPVYKTNIAEMCAGCHADKKHMAPYSIPTDQFALYRKSVHGEKLLKEGDLAAPTCNTCHGNHGAAPPGLRSVTNACGNCHANNLEYFNQSPHKRAFAEMDIGECNACHGHHDVEKTRPEFLGVGENSMCITCHDEGDPGYESAKVMAADYDSLRQSLQHARELLQRAERGGVNVSLGKFDLHSADDALVKARTAVHYFDSSKFNQVIRAGLADAEVVTDLGEEAMRNLKVRQIGLAFTIPLVLLVALALYLKIRQIERRKPYS
jgi:predicted CXXCH cytochrome family protein